MLSQTSVYDLLLKNCTCLLVIEHSTAKIKPAVVLIKLMNGELSKEELKPKYRSYFWQLKLGGGIYLELADSKSRDEVQLEKWLKSIFENVAELTRTDSGNGSEDDYLPRNFLGDPDQIGPVDFPITEQIPPYKNKITRNDADTGGEEIKASKQRFVNSDKPQSAAMPGFVEREVFFGTNRAFEYVNEKPVFNTKRNRQNSFGYCSVSIPEKHTTGDIERPAWWEKLVGVKPRAEKHMVILDTKLLDTTAFLAQMAGEHYTSNDVLLFVHGYNVEFDEAILRTAQLSWDLNFEGAAVTYCWPSQGNLQGYFSDEAAAEYSRPHFTELLQLLMNNATTGNLYIIAHSMGSRVVSRTLEKLHDAGVDYGSRIKQLIFAAPDIDAEIFSQQIAPAFSVLNQVTLYASARDRALWLSEFVRYDYPRAGQGGENICIVPGVDTIDASEVNTDLLGHGYFAATQPLIHDIYNVIKNAHRPDKRLLKEVFSGNLKYWKFARD
jgi:esterase/lipase superfamily enzyme